MFSQEQVGSRVSQRDKCRFRLWNCNQKRAVRCYRVVGVNGAASAGEAACQAVGGSLATGFDSVTSPRLLEVLLGAPGDHLSGGRYVRKVWLEDCRCLHEWGMPEQLLGRLRCF